MKQEPLYAFDKNDMLVEIQKKRVGYNEHMKAWEDYEKEDYPNKK